VTTFSFLAGAGATLGLWQVVRRAQQQHARRLLDFALLTLLGALLGARVFYVAVHGVYYSAHPIEALQFWQGGFSWPGAAAGALLALALISLVTRRSLAWLADGLSPLLGPLAIGLWLGCWQVGVDYGQSLTTASLGFPTVDEAGTVSLRVPLQMLCALGLLAYLWLADRGLAALNGKRGHPGLRASLFSLGLGLDLLVAELLRADPVAYWGSLSADTWCALGLIGLSLIAIAASLVKFNLPRQE
jgi:phosphatidylglycerol:prolipoprotein diacylglycerol transferase